MQATQIAGCSDHAQAVSRNSIRLGWLLLLIAVVAIGTSCGTASAAPSQAQALALSGSLPSGTVDKSYNAVLSVGGGTSPYQFSVASGTLPPGIKLNPSTGSFTGTPSTPGNYSFQVVVTDSPGTGHGSQQYSVQVTSGGGGVSVSISPASVTLNSGAGQQFTASVSGTPNTAVAWTATLGSVSSSGAYVAPSVQSTTSATVTATSVAYPTLSASASVTINPAQKQALQITTGGLPQGQQGTAYNAAFTATGGTQPYRWTISSGTPPAGLTLSTSGDLGGTPTATGTFGFTVTVTDAAKSTASGNFSVTVQGSSGYDGPAQLPVVTVPSSMADSPAPGSVINVAAGGDFKGALSSAQCGDTIQLAAGATFVGPFTILAKNCDDQHWIIIRTSSPDSALPAEGQRLTPCYAGVSSLPGRPAYSCSNPTNVLAKVEQDSGGTGPFLMADGANFYRFVGLEITRAAGISGSMALMTNQGTADHIIVDRSWLHGNPQDETANGYGMAGGTYIAVIDSYFNDFHCYLSCTDSHAVSSGVGDHQDGPYLIQNNFLEAAGEAIMFGGGEATLTPTDIEIIGNHFWKPWQWMQGNNPFVGGLNGNPFIVKNHLEFKNAVRVLVENNILENSWGGFTQTGFGILVSPKNQHKPGGTGGVCPLCQVTDITIRYSRISHAGGGIVLATDLAASGKDGGGPALAGTRWSLHDLVLDDISKNYVGEGYMFEVSNGWPKNPLNTVTINHITGFPDSGAGAFMMGNQDTNPQMYGFVFTNSIVTTGRYPVWNTGGGSTSCAYQNIPITSLGTCFTTYTFNYNGLIGAPPRYDPSTWPTGNMFAASPSVAQFTNYNNGNGGNYQLLPSSPYVNAGSDGRNLGADIVGLNAALAGVE